ncbi:hypothetical protein [Sinorhizobium saheli]|uniref:Uncharacterized protein n=1 Tax=Sinorhizobium saheli TaxID=36856 RepID=A0A178YRJ3_SINSA|nr:hypothetical protein ATB98_12425 [Sinorhizobium saheli]
MSAGYAAIQFAAACTSAIVPAEAMSAVRVATANAAKAMFIFIVILPVGDAAVAIFAFSTASVEYANVVCAGRLPASSSVLRDLDDRLRLAR